MGELLKDAWVYAIDSDIVDYTEDGVEGGIRAEPFSDVTKEEAIQSMKDMYGDHLKEFAILDQSTENKIFESGLEPYYFLEPSATPEKIKAQLLNPDSMTLQEIQDLLDRIKQAKT